MARDKAKDEEIFNCIEENEHKYILGLYNEEKQKVKEFLIRKSLNKTIKNFTYMNVYLSIKTELELDIPN